MEDETARLTLELPAAADSGEIFDRLMAAIGGRPAAGLTEEIARVSALIAGSVRGAGLGQDDVVSIELRLGPHPVRLEITSAGMAFEPWVSGQASEDRVGGWGLAFVDQAAERWGVVQDEGRSTVWFEIRPTG
jgi:hypothetical protein